MKIQTIDIDILKKKKAQKCSGQNSPAQIIQLAKYDQLDQTE